MDLSAIGTIGGVSAGSVALLGAAYTAVRRLQSHKPGAKRRKQWRHLSLD